MTRATGQRLYRACQRCRQRKLKCNLDSVGEPGRPPCLDCYRTGHECILPESRRGGNYAHLRKPRTRQAAGSSIYPLPSVNESHASGDVQDTLGISADEEVEHREDNENLYAELKNPFDALKILAQAAVNNEGPSEIESCEQGMDTLPLDGASANSFGFGEGGRLSGSVRVSTAGSEEARLTRGIKDYALVLNGLLNLEMILMLLQHYAENYHSFVPIVPKFVLEPLNIDQIAVEEPFLLTAIMTIASRNDPSLENVHQHCWEYMKLLLLDVILGASGTQQVGSVEGLLLLSDWVPYNQYEDSSNSRSPRRKAGVAQDSTAWSLVGQAVRLAYFLRLDRTSFREKISGESKAQVDRKRLTWTFVYIADRQISVRMGQSFWSRGPALSTRFTANDFPSLQPKSETEEDHASVLQATVELTQLLHNVHDILYSSKTRTMEMMLMGDYSRYLDDFLNALMGWQQTWGGLNVPPRLKHTLSLMYEYLRLYVNAFSFQSVISRASSKAEDLPASSSYCSPGSLTLFPRAVMASPDGRYVFESIRAAKMVLKVMAEIDATTFFRSMPSRFYLYGLYSAVFLYRANKFGALTVKDEIDEVIKLVRGFMSALENSSSGSHTIGLRYSKLLESLWFPSFNRPIRESTQQALGQKSIHISPFKSQLTGEFSQSFGDNSAIDVPDIVIPATLGYDSMESSNFDLFYEDFSNFDGVLFGLFPQSGLDADKLEEYSYQTAPYISIES